MAVAFANNWDIILSKLESLFRTEFKGALKVYSGLQNEMEGNQYLRLSPTSSSLVDYSATLETREFSIVWFCILKNLISRRQEQIM